MERNTRCTASTGICVCGRGGAPAEAPGRPDSGDGRSPIDATRDHVFGKALLAQFEREVHSFVWCHACQTVGPGLITRLCAAARHHRSIRERVAWTFGLRRALLRAAAS